MTCPIWGTAADLQPPLGDSQTINSIRAGGRFIITGTMKAIGFANLEDSEKARLTTWIVDQHRAGIEFPKVTSECVEFAKLSAPLTFTSKIDRFFELFGRKTGRIGQRIIIHEPSNDPAHKEVVEEFCAWLELIDKKELLSFCQLLKTQCLIEHEWVLRLTAEGYSRLDLLRTNSGATANVFVAMWYDSSTKDAYDRGIYPAICACGYDPIRIDNKQHTNKICDEIVAEIRRARFLVADFTCGFMMNLDETRKVFIARGGVYFEAGYALGLGKRVIWICHEECLDGVHFDTRQYAHIVWKEPTDLYKSLHDRIAAVEGMGPNKKIDFETSSTSS